MITSEPLAGVFATMLHGSAPGLAIAAALTEHCHRYIERMRSREKARDEPTIVPVVNVQILHLMWQYWYPEKAVSWTIHGGAIGLAAVCSVSAEQQTKPGRR